MAFALVYALAAAMLFRSQLYAHNPDILAWGITFDLTLTIPAAWYLFVVRPGHARPLSLIPLFVICTVVASRLVPHAQHGFIDQLRFVAAPLDLITLWLVVRRLARGRSIEEVLGNSPAAKIVALEVTTLYYATCCWRKRRADGFTFHERSGWGSIVACFLVVLAAESIGMHLFVAHFSAKVAWIVTTLDVYGMLWIIGDYHALRLLTTTVDRDAIHFRLGLRWSATIERANIASIDAPRGESDWKRKGRPPSRAA